MKTDTLVSPHETSFPANAWLTVGTVEEETVAASGPALQRFAAALRTLYEAAGKPVQGSLLQLNGGSIGKSSLSDWLRGRSAPSPANISYFFALVRHLNAKAAQQGTAYIALSDGGWQELLRAARTERDRNRGGRPPRPTGPQRPARQVGNAGQQHGSRVLASHAAWVEQYVRSTALLEREAELRELEAFCAAPDAEGQGAYVWWQAGPWAGKSALMAEFVCGQPVVEAEVVSYFIGERFGNNDRDAFAQGIHQQLAAVAGQAPTQTSAGPQEFAGLCATAAEACRARGRRLVIVVDGLDEDRGSEPGEHSIAALLPKHPPANMRVIVTGRPHPPVPSDVPPDHPLRDRNIVRPLNPSPRAQVISDVAERELRQLLDDTPVGNDLLGVLVAARGALSDRDLSDLLDVRPHDVRRRLRSIAGRSFVVDEHRHLARPGPAVDQDLYLLGHEELRRIAVTALGPSVISGCEARLHAWADGYRAKGWPPDTPSYLLYDYSRLLRNTGSTEQFVSLVLEPRRQLALLARSSVDTALGELEAARQLVEHEGSEDFGVLAALAASRDLLHDDARALPPSIPVAFACLGHSKRAIGLARTAPYTPDKANRLAQVARALTGIDRQHAVEAAQEAARWAEQARYQSSPANGDEYDAEVAAGEAAVALISVGQDDDGRALLDSLKPPAGDGDEIFTCSTAVQASLAAAPRDARLAEELLDVAERFADELASGWTADPTAPVRAWAAVVRAASPPRTGRVEERISQYAHTLPESLQACAVHAVAASALAASHPGEAAVLTQQAARPLKAALRAPLSLSRDDRSHLHILLELMLESVVQALVSTGAVDKARQLVAEVPEDLRTEWFGRDILAAARALLPDAPRAVDRPHTAQSLAQQACDLAGQGQRDHAELRLQEALNLLAASPQKGRWQAAWLIMLCAALAAVGNAADAQRLAEDLNDPVSQVHALAAAASAAALRQMTPAQQLARTAADQARALADADNFKILDGAPGTRVAAAKRAAAHALALARDRDGALALAQEVGKPDSPRHRHTLIAVAAGLRSHDPATAAHLIDQERQRMLVRASEPGSRITELAELAAAIGDAHPASRQQIDKAIEHIWAEDRAAQKQATLEEILVAVIVASPTQQREAHQALERSWHTWSQAPPAEIPIDAFAVAFAAFQDFEAAHRAAQLHRDPADRAQALAAVAAYLTHTSTQLQPLWDSSTTAFTDTLRYLALLDIPPNTAQAAAWAHRFLAKALASDGWHHALPVLARIDPDAVRRVRDLVFTHRNLDHPPTAAHQPAVSV
ncbi:hypothetical protein AB0O86_34300 [Streptomyces hirsutus]|uniref:hypothetical protein n=1 Tax=Streptomyces hirsutus TaxID=35620 RepID=UPI00342B3944